MKVKQFSIGPYRIDLLRSVVISNTSETTVEPKMLQVLLLLAENQGEVVTHQEIMSKVWPNVEVVPNALQRCIAQLRKILGDDGKTQSIITTQTRIGYSLVAQVYWHTSTEQSVQNAKEHANVSEGNEIEQITVDQSDNHKHPIEKWFILFLIVVVTLFILVINWQAITSQLIAPTKVKSPVTEYTKIIPQTQSDQHESHPIYSNDGEYIVFNRHVDICTGNLWAKNTSSGEEIKLTENIGIYGKHSFNADGSQLIFAAQANCQAVNPGVKNCWNIATIDFANALSTQQKPQLRYECQAALLETPKALTNSQYAFLQWENNRYSLMHYDDRSKKTKTLFARDNRKIYYFDYDHLKQRFAVISREGTAEIIDTLALDGTVIMSNQIQRLPAMSQYQHFEANFIPGEDYLLTSSYLGPHLLSLEGMLTPITVPENHILDLFKQRTTNKLLAIRGMLDFDVAEISINQSDTEVQISFNQQVLPYASFARTTSSETDPSYQPNGEGIAFISNRSGSDQIWLWQNNQTTQLTPEDNNRPIDHFAWSPNGDRLAYVLNDQVTTVDLNGQITKLKANQAIFSVLNWYSENQLLVTINDNKNLYLFDVSKQQLVDLNLTQVKRAWVENNTLVYVTKMNEVWQADLTRISSTKQLLPGIFGKSVLLKSAEIYHVEPETRTLFKYNIHTRQQSKLFQLKEKAWWIKDIKANKLLLSQAIAVKKEVIELSP